MTRKPLDQRLAGILVRPLKDTPVHPNHLTALSLAFGLLASALFAFGGPGAADWAALVFMLAVFADHTDGELARLAGKTSRFGYYFDYLAGSANYTLLFPGIGLGLYWAGAGAWALVLGLAAGLANPFIVTLRLVMDHRHGPQSVEHPSGAGFELEDFIYLIGPITWFVGVELFLIGFGLGALGYLARTVWEFRRWQTAAPP